MSAACVLDSVVFYGELLSSCCVLRYWILVVAFELTSRLDQADLGRAQLPDLTATLFPPKSPLPRCFNIPPNDATGVSRHTNMSTDADLGLPLLRLPLFPCSVCLIVLIFPPRYDNDMS